MRPAIEAGLMLFVEAATLFMRPVPGVGLTVSPLHVVAGGGGIGKSANHRNGD